MAVIQRPNSAVTSGRLTCAQMKAGLSVLWAIWNGVLVMLSGFWYLVALKNSGASRTPPAWMWNLGTAVSVWAGSFV